MTYLQDRLKKETFSTKIYVFIKIRFFESSRVASIFAKNVRSLKLSHKSLNLANIQELAHRLSAERSVGKQNFCPEKLELACIQKTVSVEKRFFCA